MSSETYLPDSGFIPLILSHFHDECRRNKVFLSVGSLFLKCREGVLSVNLLPFLVPGHGVIPHRPFIRWVGVIVTPSIMTLAPELRRSLITVVIFNMIPLIHVIFIAFPGGMALPVAPPLGTVPGSPQRSWPGPGPWTPPTCRSWPRTTGPRPGARRRHFLVYQYLK